MNFLLDTNVISEWVKPQPGRNVVSWLAEVDEDRVFVSVIAVAELRHRIELMSASWRRTRLAQWLTEELPLRFENRVLAINPPVADAWGVVMARSQSAGHSLGAMDAFVAAIAEAHALTLVTRNVKDFRQIGIPLLDPWEPRP